MSDLDSKIESYRANGWTVKEKVGDDRAIMVKKSWGNKIAHLCMFLPTLGMFNIIYGLWCRFIKSEKTTVTA